MTNPSTPPDSSSDLPNIGAPARRALASIGVHDLAGVGTLSRNDLLALHGFGPKALRILAAVLAAHGLGFREE